MLPMFLTQYCICGSPKMGFCQEIPRIDVAGCFFNNSKKSKSSTCLHKFIQSHPAMQTQKTPWQKPSLGVRNAYVTFLIRHSSVAGKKISLARCQSQKLKIDCATAVGLT